jgi:hypothetical protein
MTGERQDIDLMTPCGMLSVELSPFCCSSLIPSGYHHKHSHAPDGRNGFSVDFRGFWLVFTP